MYTRIHWILFILLLLSLPAQSQQIRIHGSFGSDSIKLGQEVPYSLTVTYSPKLKINLPDSSYDYHPFELNHRKWFPTAIKNSLLYDSVIYYLTTFELDTVLHFRMPVYVVKENDSITYYTDPDSIYLKQVITQLPDSLKLKADTQLLKSRQLFNYPVWLIISALLIVLVTAVTIFFGKKIMKALKLYRLKRKHRIFVEKFFLRIGKLRDSHSDGDPEHVLHDWKKYMESLEKAPYTKLTTRELVKIYNDTALIENLKAIDRFIYGNVKEKPLHEYFSKLLEYSVMRFKVRIKEIQDGE